MTEPTVLGGRYEIGALLGSGGMAEVHVGRDVRLGRQVAVKMLRPDLARDPSFQARFRREAQSAASLNHPAVVAVYDTGEDGVAGGSVPYIVMEYVDGSTLRELLNSGRRLLPERALEIVAGVLDALDYSHRHGIVHRDIKPANVMLTTHGDVKVMDFGIARALADTSATMTQTSAVIGTAQYLSPEQARGETVDARSDLYSTGCLLYELLTGRPPFVGDSPVSVAYQHVREEPVPPSHIDPDVPAAADAIVLKALVKDREQRYQTAAEMRADIHRALAGAAVEAPMVAPVTQTLPPIVADPSPATAMAPAVQERPRGGHGWAWALLALAVVAVFAVAAVLGQGLFDDTATEQVRVPAVVGQQQEEAERLLREAGLEVAVEQDFSTEQPAGVVLDVQPVAGTPVDQGSSVQITVSQGEDERSVPQLAGLSLEEARDALRDAGLELGSVVPQASAEEEGRVLESDPSPGETLPVGSTVSLVVASGSNEVPGVVGESQGSARSEIEDAGFAVEIEEQEVDSPEQVGQVVDQQPGPGSERRLGSTVTLLVGVAGEEEPTPTDEPTLELPPEEEPPPAAGGGDGEQDGQGEGGGD